MVNVGDKWMDQTNTKYRFSRVQFARGFWLWMLGIPINFLPLMIRYIVSYEAQKEYELVALVKDIVSDLDFLFVFLSALFVLYVQGEYTTEDYTGAARICKRICLLVFAPLLILVVFLYSFPVFRAMLYDGVSLEFNIAIMSVTVLIGVLSHAAISMVKTEGE